MALDSFHERAIKSLRERHESQIAENAERIRDHIGYVLNRIESGRADATGLYAQDIAASVQRMLLAVAALETLSETGKILQTGDTPASGG